MLCAFFAIKGTLSELFYLRAEGPCSECVMTVVLETRQKCRVAPEITAGAKWLTVLSYVNW